MSKTETTTACCAKVPKGSDGWRTSYAQCTRAGKVERAGKWYCGQHDPEAKEAKRQATQDRWRAEGIERDRQRRLADAAPDLLAALKAVVSVADRKTVEFDAARAAIAKAEGAETHG